MTEISCEYVRTRNVTKTAEIRMAGITCPVGLYPRNSHAPNMAIVTTFTDMNEYTNASNLDQPLTSPVALRRNRVGASPTVAIDSNPLVCLPDANACSAERQREIGTDAAARQIPPFRSSVD